MTQALAAKPEFGALAGILTQAARNRRATGVLLLCAMLALVFVAVGAREAGACTGTPLTLAEAALPAAKAPA